MILSSKYKNLFYDLDLCRFGVSGKYCFKGRLIIGPQHHPLQEIEMILNKTNCTDIADTVNEISMGGIDCKLKCSPFRGYRRGQRERDILTLLYKDRKGPKPFLLKGHCRLK
ncbi:MAG: hypothetical protein DRQ88_11970 [Epsilonproteobacteria bacterium]|nr:MAG: hypothetical protein DRQ89_11570 [Campylobacterota bacterium]RLA63756.1 MAG: hypothetical protein DRQ88_11970 [Campylobacterota bacterium]